MILTQQCQRNMSSRINAQQGWCVKTWFIGVDKCTLNLHGFLHLLLALQFQKAMLCLKSLGAPDKNPRVTHLQNEFMDNNNNNKQVILGSQIVDLADC